MVQLNLCSCCYGFSVHISLFKRFSGQLAKNNYHVNPASVYNRRKLRSMRSVDNALCLSWILDADLLNRELGGCESGHH